MSRCNFFMNEYRVRECFSHGTRKNFNFSKTLRDSRYEPRLVSIGMFGYEFF